MPNVNAWEAELAKDAKDRKEMIAWSHQNYRGRELEDIER
jgi:hypothetical protein